MNTFAATAKYIRMSPRKLRLVAGVVRGLNPNDALSKLAVVPQNAAGPLAAVIRSAVANAKEKNAQEDTLVLDAVEVMEGPVMKRWRPASRGRAHGYKKRMSHIKVVLRDKK